jgi:phosphoribosylformimino-5-aminoimidazole carboxamide ribotide isomerase
MLIIPAIDIRGANCVRLTQGKLDAETIYSKDPAFIAKLFQAKGAKRLHVVDLDGAFHGIPQNLEVVKKIRAGIDIPIEFGGGVRSLKAIDSLFEIGVNYVVMGTVAIYNPEIVRQAIEKYGDKIMVAVDANEGKVAIGGWKSSSTSISAGAGPINPLRISFVSSCLRGERNSSGHSNRSAVIGSSRDAFQAG